MMFVTYQSHGFVRDGQIVREIWTGKILKETIKPGPSGWKKYYVVERVHDKKLDTIKVDAVREYIFNK